MKYLCTLLIGVVFITLQAQENNQNKQKIKLLTKKTDRFSVPIPSNWHVENTDMGILAYDSDESRDFIDRDSIRIVALEGFHFLDYQTIFVLLQQQGCVGSNMERISEDEIVIDDQMAMRILFKGSKKSKSSWWIGCRYKKTMYVVIITGDVKLFNGENSIAKQVVSGLKFASQKHSSKSLKMTKESKNITQPLFELSLPKKWKSDSICNVFFASSSVFHKGQNVGFMVFSHQSREMQSMDLSLILLLFRQEVTKGFGRVGVKESDTKLGEIPGKMLDLSVNDHSEHMQIITAKHEFTAYVILIKGPKEIWHANPNFDEEIRKSFRHK